uniref:Uncharacterized protein n=1 Tax=Plectus sambesii TaxID=2011161 RepID=A0A914WQF2_9BILA
MLFCTLAPTTQKVLMALISLKTIDDVMFKELHSALNQYFRVSPLPLAEYFKFFAACQDPNQLSANYIIQLHTLAASCSWPISLDRALAIIFIMGISSNKLQKQLLKKDYPLINLALEQANQYYSILCETLCTSSSCPASSTNLAASVNQVWVEARVQAPLLLHATDAPGLTTAMTSAISPDILQLLFQAMPPSNLTPSNHYPVTPPS